MNLYRCMVVVILLGMLLSPLAPAAPAYADAGKTSEPYPGSAVCLPDAYLSTPGDCLPLGPSQTLTALAKKGMAFPLHPLPAVKPPSDLTNSPVQIAKINIEATDPA